MKLYYFDYSSSTPLDAKVFNAMKPFLASKFGNPSSLHQKGIEAKKAIEVSRKKIAQIISARPEEIIFTSGGTESCNLALLGLTRNYAEEKNAELRGNHLHIITTSIEHHAVLESVKYLQKNGAKVTYLKVDRQGFVRVSNIKKAIFKDTVLISVMYANNEIGTIEPIAEIGRMLSQINLDRLKKRLPPVLFHTDACQAAGSLTLNVNHLQVDLMSVSASKIYGPKGVGFLYARRGIHLNPIIHGGGQERGIRSGTENVAGIVGMAKALELVVANQEKENKRLLGLQMYLIDQIHKKIPSAILNGAWDEYPTSKTRLPNNVNITIPGIEGEALMLYLDAQGICVSTGSACATGSTDASHVLKVIGRSNRDAKSSIRVSIGKYTKKTDIDYLIRSLIHNTSILKGVYTFNS